MARRIHGAARSPHGLRRLGADPVEPARGLGYGVCMRNNPFGADRFARWGLLITALVASAALCATAYVGYRNTGKLAEVAGLGQAEVFLRTLRAEFAESSPPDRTRLEVYLQTNADLGLHYVAVVDLEGRVVIEVGEPLDRVWGSQAGGRERSFDRVDNRFRIISQLPPPSEPGGRRPLARGGPPDPQGHVRGGPPDPQGHVRGGPPDPQGHGRRPPPWHRIVIEFEPTVLRELESGATAILGMGIAVSTLLMGAAVVFWRLSRRAHAAEVALEKQRRLAALGEMSAVLAHEIKNPLGALKGHAQLLEESLPEGGREHAKAVRVVQEAIRLQRLIDQLLDYVRSKRLNVRPTDPAGLLREAAEALDGTRVEVDAACAPAQWLLDGPRLHQALTNILQNALQASPEETNVAAWVGAERGQLLFTIRDYGPGIPAEERERIFEPFHTQRVQGVGLGLAVARQIVEAHGGTLSTDNHAEGGAVFRLSIPPAVVEG